MLHRPIPNTFIIDKANSTVISSFFTTTNKEPSPVLLAEQPPLVASDHALQQKYRQIRGSAIRRGLGFHLSEQTCKTVFRQPCFYCGQCPTVLPEGGVMGLDRMDSSKGYFRDNIVACCSTCNYMKGNLTIERFREHCKRITDHSMYLQQQSAFNE